MVVVTSPLQLSANSLASFYRGAGRIRDFRNDLNIDTNDAEDWIASTISRFGAGSAGPTGPSGSAGLTRLAGGSTLRDLLAASPDAWFGPGYIQQYGQVASMLTKLLDAGSRLPLHVHPDRPFARQHLGSDFGKTEAWLVLHADPGASAHLGFSRTVGAQELASWVTQQDTQSLLATCNQFPVRTGDVLLCPGGVPHSIGEGMLILEIQEMTDFSIILEWAGYPIDPDRVFLGLDSDVALAAVWREGIQGAELEQLRGRSIVSLASDAVGATSLLPAGAAGFFAAEQIVADSDGVAFDRRFAVIVINEGYGQLTFSDADPVPVSAGDTYLVPYAAGEGHLSGPLSAIRCYPTVGAPE